MSAFEIFGLSILLLTVIGCFVAGVVNHRRNVAYEDYLQRYKQYRDDVRRESRSRL